MKKINKLLMVFLIGMIILNVVNVFRLEQRRDMIDRLFGIIEYYEGVLGISDTGIDNPTLSFGNDTGDFFSKNKDGVWVSEDSTKYIDENNKTMPINPVLISGTAEVKLITDYTKEDKPSIEFGEPVEIIAQIIEHADGLHGITVKTADGETYMFIQREDGSWIREEKLKRLNNQLLGITQ